MTKQPDNDASGLEAMLDELAQDHEAMRMRILELLRLLEEAVDVQVAAERRAEEMAAQAARIDRELRALQGTRLFRAAAPFRAIYGRLLRRRR